MGKKMKMHSPNLADENIAKIYELFPGCVTEATDESGKLFFAVDFDQLRQELSNCIVEGPQERYRLDWPGKKEAILTANTPIAKTLRPKRSDSVNFEETGNLFIEGDNLEALKLIQESFLGRVDMIYIDPPYNTGRNLIYKNDYSETVSDFLERSNQKSEEKDKLVANPETSGRFHSEWLSMMYPRLRVAKNILKRDGVLVCAIDENEFGTLSVLLKEVFSGSAWEHAYVSVVHNPRGQQGANFSYVNEYLIFIYPSGVKAIGDRQIREEDVSWSQFRNWGGESERRDAKNCFYPVMVKGDEIVGFGDVVPDHVHPAQTEWDGDIAYVYPIDNQGIERKWRYARQSVDEISMMLRARKDANGYQIEIGKTFGRYKSVWTDKRYDSNEYGTKLINNLVEGSGFTFPKSLWAVYDPIEAVTRNNKDAIILDFFAGSATTAHAVMQLNANDDGNRKFIMVQVPEPIPEDSPPFKNGFHTIAEISKERIRQAGKQLATTSTSIDMGMRVLKVDSSNMSSTYYSAEELTQGALLDAVENVKPDRTDPEDLLFQVLVDWGVDLTLPIRRETISDKTVFFVNHEPYDLIACFDYGVTEELVKELAKHEPARVVFRDNGFVSDAVKINVEQIFKQLSPSTDVKSI
ncbi:site-specific DNA-methyltransferase [Parvularcula sp. LCG005]|uniref:site-specific DNA-methyltransferase n=1 Tax=Parvularcula sp. LCG005 TaxID=3078805 RepID=UPI0029430650|nr:site-specific DNA-methyltransferase [Parvularcula sp. LCG005]WOI52589.1 site-specific DNA-methyltransferase [Parvularcula sp. LCG005]